MDVKKNPVTSANPLKDVTYPSYMNGLSLQQRQLQPMMEYYYENQGCTNQQIMFSTMSYPFMQQNATGEENCFYYQLFNNVQGYRWMMPKNPMYYSNGQWHETSEYKELEDFYPVESEYCKGDGEKPVQSHQKISSKMHPVQLLHQIFRKEAFVMEYERINDGPFSQVRVTYKVNGKMYSAEATRLKEARRLCAKQVLRDQFPDLKIEMDNDIPQPEYDVKQFDNKHPVQILYQIFRYEPMEMHCEEEGAAHFAKHIFTFVIRGKKFIAKAETIKEAKRRAAILALNDYFKKEN